MKYTYFDIQNFKGIQKLRLDLSRTPETAIHTLVGLNESGKTTVLEAINLLSQSERLDPLGLPGYVEPEIHNLIPIAQRSNFNDVITIAAGVELDELDEKAVSAALRGTGTRISEPIGSFQVAQSYRFKNSKLLADQPKNTWSLVVRGKVGSQRKPRKIAGEAWQKAVLAIMPLLPRILYFPNFLFEFPDRIYLDAAPVEKEKHEFYRTILQDVLDAIGEGTTLQDHVLARAESQEQFEKKSLESVLLKMGNHITKTVFSNWDRIFKRPPGRKEIIVSIDRQAPTGPWYLQLRLKEGNELYEISERSLGFRWFFTFLLLTQYRGFRRADARNVLFLLDEPASNLHPSAQAQLLDSFEKLPRECGLVYTTHSHHMIRPEWLDGAFVVRNGGMDYETAEEDYTARNTVITLHPYREFAASHPEQSTYFQPVLDVLDYRPGPLENIPDVVMLEGKNDFYTLRFMQQTLGLDQSLNLLPGGGAGSLTDVMRLYVGWGRNFITVLDSDSEGEKQRIRYRDVLGSCIDNRLFTLQDVDGSWSGVRMEGLFLDDDRLALQKMVYPAAGAYHKSHFNRALQELYLTKKPVNLAAASRDAFRQLIEWLIAKLRAVDAIAASGEVPN